jgi:hypothetical protein
MQSSEEYDVIESYEKRYPNNQTPNEIRVKEAEARNERILKVQAEADASFQLFKKDELVRMDAEAAKRLIE